MHNLGSHPQPLPTKFATAAVETNPLTDAESRVHQSAGWFPQQQLQTLLGVAVGVTPNCALCQVCHRGNLRDVNVIYVISLTKFAANSVARDSASVSRLVSTAAAANFIGSGCGCDPKLCIVSIMSWRQSARR